MTVMDQTEELHEPTKVYVLKAHYEMMSPNLIRGLEEECKCVLVPVDEEEKETLNWSVVRNFEIPKMPEIIFEKLPTSFNGSSGKGHGTPHTFPKDYAKKKKAKRRAQKQARRKR